MQDTHIQARIQQFRDDKSVYECPVVKEYIESGRGDKVDESTEGACTVSQVINNNHVVLKKKIWLEFQICKPTVHYRLEKHL